MEIRPLKQLCLQCLLLKFGLYRPWTRLFGAEPTAKYYKRIWKYQMLDKYGWEIQTNEGCPKWFVQIYKDATGRIHCTIR